MDLVAGVRKEGSRGGRGDFKWEDVRDSQHRENYLGHSLMAPVGRWQKNRDLNWYAKGDKSDAALAAAEARKEEIRRIKEAEESALSEALGYGPTISKNANETPIGQKEVERAIKETAEGDDEEGAKGVGFGAFVGGTSVKEGRDVLGGEGLDRPIGEVLKERRRDGDGRKEKEMKRRSRSRDRSNGDGRKEKEKKRRSRSRDRSRERRHRRHPHDEGRSHRRHRSRDPSHHRSTNRSRERRPYRREQRSRSYEIRRDEDRPSRRRQERSYSPDIKHGGRRNSGDRDRDYDYRR